MEPGARALLHANQPSLRLPAALPPSSRSLLRASSSRLRRSLLSSGPAAARFPLPGFPARPPRRWRAAPGLAGGPASDRASSARMGRPGPTFAARARPPARPACGEANALGGGGPEPRQRPRDKPGSGRKSQKNKARSGRAGSFPHRLPALVRAAEPHSFELWSSPPPLTNTPTCPQRLRAVTLASQHPRPRAQLRASALINQKGPYN